LDGIPLSLKCELDDHDVPQNSLKREREDDVVVFEGSVHVGKAAKTGKGKTKKTIAVVDLTDE